MRRVVLFMLLTIALLLGAPGSDAQSPGIDADEAAAQLRDVMNDPLFSRWERRQQRADPGQQTDMSWLEERVEAMADSVGDFFEWLFERDRQTTPPSGGATGGGGGGWFEIGSLFKLMGWVLLIVCVLLIVWALIGRVRWNAVSVGQAAPDRQTLDRALDTGDALVASSAAWADHAGQLAGEQDLRQAFRAMYLALLSGLHAGGAIRFRPQRTNWTYADGFNGSDAHRATFRQLTSVFDDVWYGQQQPDTSSFATIRRDVDGLLREHGGEGGSTSAEGGHA